MEIPDLILALKDSGPLGLGTLIVLCLLFGVLAIRKNAFQEGETVAKFRETAMEDLQELTERYRRERDLADARADRLMRALRWWNNKAHDLFNQIMNDRQRVKISAIKDGRPEPEFLPCSELPELIEDDERIRSRDPKGGIDPR